MPQFQAKEVRILGWRNVMKLEFVQSSNGPHDRDEVDLCCAESGSASAATFSETRARIPSCLHGTAEGIVSGLRQHKMHLIPCCRR
jgi:hypothetical protein